MIKKTFLRIWEHFTKKKKENEIDNKNKPLFNVFYINFSKVYEIKMMLSNIIKTDFTVAAEKNEHINAKVRAEMGINFFALINSELGSSSGNSQKVLETFKVTTTKSLILSEVIQKSKHVSTLLDGLKIGALIRIDNVSLSLENELELRSVRTFSNNSDLFKGMSLPEVEGLDASNLLNAVLKDYAYKIKGKTSTGERVLIKIPLTFENEFENSYSIDDLFIGDVTVVGIYKGKTTTQKLKGTFEYFQKLGQESEKDENSDCELKNSEVVEVTKEKSEIADDNNEYDYIDLLAIIQIVNME